VRVLLVTDWVPDEGGVEAYVSLLRDELLRAGDDVRLLTSNAGSAAAGAADYVTHGSTNDAAQTVLQVVNPFAVRTLRAALREFRPDVVHVSMFEMHLSPAIFQALAGVPTVLNVAYYKPICPIGLKLLPDGSRCTVPPGLVCWRSGCVSLPHWLRDRPRYALIDRALSGTTEILVCSDWLRRELARHGVESVEIPYPVLPAFEGYRRAPAEAPTFLYVGRLAVEKGVDVLLRAFARLLRREPEAALRVAGDGPERARLEGLTHALGIEESVVFCGRLDPRGVERELAGAWALAAPSLWAEPFGLVAAEAIVRRVPVVATRPGGFEETVEDGVSGLLVPAGDEDALLVALEEVLDGRLFPDRSVPAGPAARLLEGRDLDRHVAAVRGLLSELGARTAAEVHVASADQAGIVAGPP
jgi:glycosyltransferase involved in cell wall biosynthesis